MTPLHNLSDMFYKDKAPLNNRRIVLSPNIRQFGVAALMVAAVATRAFAQVTLIATPSSLTFNVAGGTPRRT